MRNLKMRFFRYVTYRMVLDLLLDTWSDSDGGLLSWPWAIAWGYFRLPVPTLKPEVGFFYMKPTIFRHEILRWYIKNEFRSVSTPETTGNPLKTSFLNIWDNYTYKKPTSGLRVGTGSRKYPHAIAHGQLKLSKVDPHLNRITCLGDPKSHLKKPHPKWFTFACCAKSISFRHKFTVYDDACFPPFFTLTIIRSISSLFTFTWMYWARIPYPIQVI